MVSYSKDEFPSAFILPDEEGTPHFFPYGAFGDAYLLNHDQLHRAQTFIDQYFVWSSVSLLFWQYFVGFHWTASLIFVLGALYFVRMQLLIRTSQKSALFTNLEEISLKLVELQTIGSLFLVNLCCFGFLFWSVYQVILAWPLPMKLLFSDFFTLAFFFLSFTYTTILLYLKGQSLQKS